MADVVNLRQARKAKARAEKDAQAERNRAAFGRTKVEKKTSAAERARLGDTLDAHKRQELDKELDKDA